ncbi:MAG: MATE family efflux transporter [Clostridia bacterium]|nr:MATE family efflux transporter [Clostridia bacterium]
MIKKFIGDKRFYKRIIVLMLPILIQNGITNFVNMLDNIMVGRVGEIEMTGVSSTNQLIFVFNLCIFGAVSGAGIFGAQFFGSGDTKGLRNTFRFKMIFCTVLSVAVGAVFLFFGEDLIWLYLKSEKNTANATAALAHGYDYLKIMLISFIPAGIVQCYSSTLRETGKTVPPMMAGVIAVLVNLVLNYVLIFGNFGAPALGVAGAAIATVTARFVEFFILVVWTARHRESNRFIIGAYKSLRVPLKLVKQIVVKGFPLMLNETMWALGMAFLNQCYSQRGMAVVTANNIVQTFFNVFSVAFMAVGVSIGIILGQLLGAGKTEEAKDTATKLIAFSVFTSVVFTVLFAVSAIFIPEIYKIDSSVKLLATRMMQICALAMPLDAFANSSYFTLRSGGEALITFIFDSGFVWVVAVPTAFVLSRFTEIPILPLYAVCQGINIIKCAIGLYFVKKGKWIKNIVSL